MTLKRIRSHRAPIAVVTLAAFYHATILSLPQRLHAQEDEPVELVPAQGPPPQPTGTPPQTDSTGQGTGAWDKEGVDALGQRFRETQPEGAEDPSASLPDITAEEAAALAALPKGGNSVSAQAAALPSGASSPLGMGESFTTQLSTGIATFNIPLSIPAARGRAQPKLDLSYSSAAGFGVPGHGWSIGAAAISRQSDRGLAGYDDRADWHAEQDRFVFGGQELVPICTVASGGTCSGVLDGEVMPAWSVGWQYFRARIESGFLRFFWSPDHRSWRVQSKDGTNLELGEPLDASGYEGGLEVNPDAPEQIYRWHVVRQYDSQGNVNASSTPSPVNVTVYRYLHDGGTVYLSDIFSTTPAAEPTTLDLSKYAHHTRLRYEARPDTITSYRQGWAVDYRLRLQGVDVATKPFAGTSTQPRQLVRRYHLSYDEVSHTSLLVALQFEGRCEAAVLEGAEQMLPSTSCPRLPASTFEYERVEGSEPLVDSQGLSFEPFSETIRDLQNSPPHSLDEALTGMADVNADGLPDVLVTAPGLFDGQHGLYVNGLAGAGLPGFAPAVRMDVQALGVVDAGVLQFSNPAVGTLDLDGDGVFNLVHMPPLSSSYSVFAPERLASGRYRWRGRAVQTIDRQEIKLDLGRRRPDARVMDVNGDGLVDVVYTSATELQTFFSLGRYPGGSDQFGQGAWTSDTTAELSTDPAVHCLPWSAQPVRFSDPDTRVAEMNGDGLADLVRLRSGQILYWPGRGNGYFGTGPLDACEGPGFVEDGHIEVDNAPFFGVASPGTLLLDDVNADGLADMVEVRNQGVDIYLNEGGYSFTARHTIAQTPFLPNASNYARLVDVDGSGSGDILWGRAREYRYIDLTGGRVPFLLTAAHNGVGKTLQLEYESTAEHMRKAAAAGQPWQSFAPTVSPVLIRSVTRDNLELIGRPAGVIATEYRYRDAVYEARQREFRGFREAVVTNVGDATSPTVMQRTVFQLGECPSGFEGSSADVCTPPERWQDNWREALKGVPVLTETFDGQGVYLSTEHTTYELRQLYTGRDGRRVTTPFPVQKDGWLYDTAAFDGNEQIVSLPEVDVALVGIGHAENRDIAVRATTGTAHVRAQTLYDDFGNTIESIREGCISGCPAAAFGITDEIATAHSDYDLAPNDDSGWLWREHTSFVSGSVNTQHRRELSHTYDSTGNLLTSTASLHGTLPLDPTGVSTPQPPNLSGGVGQSQAVLLLSNTYNAFGHITSWRGANNACGSGEVDSLYAELPVLARSRVGSVGPDGCGSGTLTHAVTHDRGLAAVTDSTDAAGQPSRYEYDGFGRLLRIWGPNPDAPGTLAAAPSLIATYQLPADWRIAPYTVVIGLEQDGDHPNTPAYHESRSFSDGFGRTFFALSQKDADASGNWLASGRVAHNAKGQQYLTCDPWFYNGNPDSFPAVTVPTTPCTSTQFDAFGRATHSYRRSGVQDMMIVRHALSTDIWDAGDYYATPHQGTPVTNIADGHGRGVVRTERIVVAGMMQQRHLLNDHLPTGEVVRVTQRTSGQPDVTRWLRYDSIGRLVLNAEPNTSPNFTASEPSDVSAVRAWRYAYNDAGDIVGMRDARGCGTNFHYDAGGRVVAEDFVPCASHHASYTAPNLSTGDGTEVFYRYDTADPDTGSIVDAAGNALEIDTSLLLGSLSSVSNLGSKAVFSYDALGRGTGVGLRVQRPGASAASLSARYTPRWYVRESTLDAQGRPLRVTTGVTTPELLGPEGDSAVTFSYSKRGGLAQVGGSYGTLLADMRVHANGKVEYATLGDAAATRRSFTYDFDLRTSDVVTARSVLPMWSSAPPGSAYTPPQAGEDPTVQALLEDVEFEYDDGEIGPGLITAIRDHRIAADWPAAAKPIDREFVHDDLHRLTVVDYALPEGGTDIWQSPFQQELTDSTRPQPVPHVSFATRVQQQSYAYDWLGNISQSRDDADGFYDNSTGTRTHGSAAAGPHQLRIASNRALAPSSPARGDLDVAYDAAGNVTDLIVRRDGTCLPAGASCWQRFNYDWDEVGQIARARRWDLSAAERTSNGTLASNLPARAPDADLRYGYDGAGKRVLKTAVDLAGNQRHTVYPFEGLELRSTTWNGTDYVLSPERVSLRIGAGPVAARVVYALEDLPSLTSGHQHVFLQFADQVSSISFVIDRATGELVEYVNYLAYGAVDSDYRPGRWGSYREPYQFAGKEADIEVGLSYFGARYYSPYLATWMSPDPVTVHDLGSEINPYTYVGGRPIMSVDPDGRFIVAAILVAAVVGALIAGAINLGTQLVMNDFQFDQVDWGIKGVGGSMLVGAVSGAVSGGLGSLATGFWSGAAVSALSGAAGYGTSVLIEQTKFNGWGLAGAVVGGGLAGGIGTAGGTGFTTSLATSTLSGGVGYLSNGLATGEWGWDSVGLSLGASYASAGAAWGMEPVSGALYDAAEAVETAVVSELFPGAAPERYRVPGIKVKRNEVSVGAEDKYGHWWIELGPDESYGWWPSEGVDLGETLGGVSGELNGVTMSDGVATSTKDWHNGDPGAIELDVYAEKGSTPDQVRQQIRDFAKSYKGDWSWPWGQNCHSFQTDLLNAANLTTSARFTPRFDYAQDFIWREQQ